MQASMVRFLVVSMMVAAILSFGCGGMSAEQGQIVTRVQWSSSASQCLADQAPIFLNGVSSPDTCRTLEKVAREEGLEVAYLSGMPTPQWPHICCSQECTVTPGGMTCGPISCGPCAY